MGNIEAGVLCHFIVQVSGLDSELKNEKSPCDVFSWQLIPAAKAELKWRC